jgi:ABC-type transport system involved in multi-copper enzyme maturation permease subunit
MKFLATLKDSLREALDVKILYVMFGLSLLVVILVASISFEHTSGEKGVKDIVERFDKGIPLPLGQRQIQLVYYTMEDFESLEPNKVPWEGKYRFTVVARWIRPTMVEEEKPKEGKKPAEEKIDPIQALVFFRRMMTQSDDELSPEEARERREIAELAQDRAALDPGALEKRLLQALRKVSAEDQEEFIAEQARTHGTMDVLDVKVQPSEDKETSRFIVEARARPESYRTWPTRMTLFYGAWTLPVEIPVAQVVHGIEEFVFGGVGAGVTMIISIIVTAFFIPNMMRKGALDLLLSKPIHRTTLLVYKFIGGLTFMFLVTTFIVVGVWLVLGLRSGLWSPVFLLGIFTLTYQFALFYSLSVLAGVLTRSPIVSILVAVAFWGFLVLAGYGYNMYTMIEKALPPGSEVPPAVSASVEAAHFILPHHKDLDVLMSMLIAEDLMPESDPNIKQYRGLFEKISWPETLGVTTTWMALFLGLACLRFSTKDY